MRLSATRRCRYSSKLHAKSSSRCYNVGETRECNKYSVAQGVLQASLQSGTVVPKPSSGDVYVPAYADSLVQVPYLMSAPQNYSLTNDYTFLVQITNPFFKLGHVN